MITLQSIKLNNLHNKNTNVFAGTSATGNKQKSDTEKSNQTDSFVKAHKKELSLLSGVIVLAAGIITFLKLRKGKNNIGNVSGKTGNPQKIQPELKPENKTENISETYNPEQKNRTAPAEKRNDVPISDREKKEAAAEILEKIKKIVQNPDKISLLSESINAENLDLLTDITNSPEIYKIKTVKDINAYLSNCKSENIEFIKQKLLPLIDKNNDKLKLDRGLFIGQIAGHLNDSTIDVLDTVAQNAENLNLNKFELTEFILTVNEKNKDLIPLIAKNAEKLGLRDCSDSEDFQKIFALGKEGIEKLIKSETK